MTSREKVLLDRLKSYLIIERDVERLANRLAELGYKMTASYSLAGAGFGGYGGSKVESLGLQRLDIERELKAKRKVLKEIDAARTHSGLNKRESELIEHIIQGGTLSSFARQRNIYKSHIYKIRDKALEKMDSYIKNNSKRMV